MRFTSLLGLLLALSGTAHAALGEAPMGASGTVPAGGRSVLRAQTVAVSVPHQEIVTDMVGGTQVVEYVGAEGQVFAVSWKGPFKPDLSALLGSHYATLVAEGAKPQTSRSFLQVSRPEVVIQSTGHMRAFEGRAYLPGALPEGFTPADIH